MRRIMHDRVMHVPIYEDLKLKPHASRNYP